MTEKMNENQLLKGLDAYGAHADEFFSPSGEIFALSVIPAGISGEPSTRICL